LFAAARIFFLMKILNQFMTINFLKYRHFSKICYQVQ